MNGIGVFVCFSLGCFAGVLGKVEIISPPMTLHEIKGGSVVFECIASGLDDSNAMSMQWVRQEDPSRNINMRIISINEMKVYGSNRYSVIKKSGLPSGQKGYDLEISDLVVDDEGRYTCSVQGVGVTEAQSYTLNVMIPPKLNFSQKDLLPKIVKLGESLTVMCKASGRPKPTITWKKLGSNLGNHTKTVNNSLIFPKVKKTDTGEYECKAENGAGSPATEVLEISVQYAPEVNVKEDIVYSGPQKTAILTCIVSASPIAKIEWMFAGNAVDQKRRNVKTKFVDLGVGVGREAQLIINNVVSDDFGVYKCIATNQYGADDKVIELTGLPKKVEITSSKKGSYSQQYTLTWQVYSHDLPLDYFLMFRVLNGTEPGPWHNSSIPANAEPKATDHKAFYKFKQLEANTRYQVRLQARNSLGVGEVSDLFEFSTAEVLRQGAGLGQRGAASYSLPSLALGAICLLFSILNAKA
ncbi:opioid-binding protein/cell adhesion molecule homolog isoform X2 [Lineus longissimus]|uniref:opioid-binding protein/cell adhesion molecule homolog isoform X2 n=1 Tax=Lineus longissimus TaxID=88925 RepID=UPI00315D7895